ncbi:MAG: peptidoglycan DD-metalloendopeptidase family protein [Prevotellaceae bacterium]|nr:peptidoglycan DD-metalloendopeptidase family protein [Prevotellaceae bacterium]
MIHNSIKYSTLTFLILISGLLRAQEPEGHNLQMLNQERKRTEEDIKNIDTQIKSIERDQKQGIQNISLLQRKIDSRKQLISTINRNISALQKKLLEKKEAIERLQADLDEVKRSCKELLTQYHSMQSRQTTWIMYIMASESVAQAYRRMRYLREIFYLLKEQADKITEMTDKLNGEIKTMSTTERELNSNIDDKNREMETLKTEERESKNVLSQLKRQEGNLRSKLDERKKEYDRLNSQMRIYMREELDRNAKTGHSDVDLLATKDFETAKGLIPWPAVGTIVAGFGTGSKHALYKNIKMPNAGIDLQTSPDAEVYAVFAGTVSKVFSITGMGQCILIRHGIYYTLYSRLASVNVKLGDEVKPRQRIGIVMNSGEGYSLHFEIYKYTEAQNPENWLLKY